jgi:uncharacterized protein (DUF2062 family)
MVMGYYITPPASYHEGDAQYGDIVVPQRPDSTYIWNGSAWAQDATLKVAQDEIVRLETERSAVAQVPAIKTLVAMTPAQVDAWILANVTDLASARTALGILAKIVAVIARAQLK